MTNENNTNETAKIFDYKTIKVKREMETLLCDAYENLGWELSSTTPCETSIFMVNLTFKRPRAVAKKIELIKLQEKLDNTLSTIEQLKAKQKNAGKAEAITVGTIGALTFGGGLSLTLTLTGTGYLIGGIALGLVGIGIGFLGYLTYKKLSKSKSQKIQPLLDTELDKLADICEQAYKSTKNA